MHGSIGTSCAVADVQGGKATIWSPTQSVYPTAQAARRWCSACQPENVRVIFTRGVGLLRHQRRRHGGLRRGAAVAGGRQAGARAALAQGRDGVGELRHRVRRSTSASALDASGTIVAWDYEAWSAAHGGRPGYNTPGNVVTGHACSGSNRAPFTPRTPAPAPTQPLQQQQQRRAVVRRRARRRHVAAAPGSCAASACCRTRVRSPFFTGPLRSPARLQNTFAHECFMDEVAAHVKADPVAYRLRHLQRPRLQRGRPGGGQGRELGGAAVAAAADVARGTRQSRSGRGIACVLLRRRQRLRRDGRRSRRRSGHRRRSRSSGSSSRRTAARSRIPTACATRSKAARCRA